MSATPYESDVAVSRHYTIQDDDQVCEAAAPGLRHASLLLTTPQQESPTQTAGVGQLRVYVPPRLVMLWRTLAVKEERSRSPLFL